MQFTRYILMSLRKRKEKRKERGLRLELERLFVSVGILISTGRGIGLYHFDLAFRDVLWLFLTLTSIPTLTARIIVTLVIWPAIQRFLATSSDPFKYAIHIRERLNERIEMAEKSTRDPKVKRQRLDDAYQEYFHDLEVNKAKIDRLRFGSSKPVSIEESKHNKSTSTKDQSSRAKPDRILLPSPRV